MNHHVVVAYTCLIALGILLPGSIGAQTRSTADTGDVSKESLLQSTTTATTDQTRETSSTTESVTDSVVQPTTSTATANDCRVPKLGPSSWVTDSKGATKQVGFFVACPSTYAAFNLSYSATSGDISTIGDDRCTATLCYGTDGTKLSSCIHLFAQHAHVCDALFWSLTHKQAIQINAVNSNPNSSTFFANPLEVTSVSVGFESIP